jgi:hypothetical protein
VAGVGAVQVVVQVHPAALLPCWWGFLWRFGLGLCSAAAAITFWCAVGAQLDCCTVDHSLVLWPFAAVCTILGDQVHEGVFKSAMAALIPLLPCSPRRISAMTVRDAESWRAWTASLSSNFASALVAA